VVKRILFTADWHLKLGQKNVPVSWAKNRFRLFLEQVKELENEADLHIIGGDLFDRVPSMEELELYFEFISGVGIKTIIFDGNHEATRKGKTFFTQLKSATTELNPLVEIIDEIYQTDQFSILPYRELHRKWHITQFNPRQPLFTHVRGAIPPHVNPEIDLNRFKPFPVVFAGDLHSHSNTQLNIVYPGSPMATQFHRTKIKTGYLMIDTSNWSWEWDTFKLPQLLRKTVTDPSEMIPTDYDHTIYEIEGNVTDLADVANSELLDKKIVRRKTEATLILSKDMSIEDELVEYLSYILELEDTQVQEILGTYHDYARDIAMG